MHAKNEGLVVAPRAARPLLVVAVALGLSLLVAGCGSMAAGRAQAPGEPPAVLDARGAPVGAAVEKETAEPMMAAEARTWQRSRFLPNTTRLMIGDREHLPLRGMQIKTTIDGFRARVLIDFHFLNDRDRRFEGTFQLRLPNEASPFFFAFGEEKIAVAADAPLPLQLFDAEKARAMGNEPALIMAERAASWRGPRQARMVPREKAAFAYGQTVRKRVDPALVEWSGPGIFSARVFPIEPGRVHRVVVGYDVDLVPVGNDLEYRLDLPKVAGPIIVDLSVSAPQGADIRVSPSAPAVPHGDRTTFRFAPPTERTIEVRLRVPTGLWLTGTDPETGEYFAASFEPDLPAERAAAAAADAIFLVDVSLSSNPDRFNIWLELLRGILESNRPSLERFAVLFFNVEAFWFRRELSDNTPENVAALMDYARSLALEGATDVAAALGQASRPDWASGADAAQRWDLFLLSDGASTWGESDLHAMSKTLAEAGKRSLYAYQTGLAGTDIGALTQLARESGGAIFSVTGESDLGQAVTAHRSRPWRLVTAELAGSTDLLIAGRPKFIFVGQRLRLAGRGSPEPNATIDLTMERDGQRRLVKARLGPAVTSQLTPRIYGQIAVDQLEAIGLISEWYSKAYATHYRVPGKTCSLLMLESEEDYRRFDIKPEQDVYVINRRPASEAVEKLLAMAAGSLGDPKATFLAWLEKMRWTPGVNLRLPEPLRLALADLPPAAFQVHVPPLRTRARTRQGIPGAVLSQLVSHQLDYDTLTQEAERRLKADGPAAALKALSSLVEERPGDGVLGRDVGYSASTWGLSAQAFHLFRRLAVTRPFEPQTYRALAKSLVAMNKIELAIAYYEVGLGGQWDSRFGDFKKILGFDYLHLLQRLVHGELSTSLNDYVRARHQRLAREHGIGAADLVVMITWNTDDTDIDLHVLEPTGEECYYEHRQTKIGGSLSEDVTQGYGPEMYVLKSARPGRYHIQAHYYASHQQRASARTKVHATIFQRWGTRREKKVEKVITLRKGKDRQDVAFVTVGSRGAIIAR